MLEVKTGIDVVQWKLNTDKFVDDWFDSRELKGFAEASKQTWHRMIHIPRAARVNTHLLPSFHHNARRMASSSLNEVSLSYYINKIICLEVIYVFLTPARVHIDYMSI